MSSDPLLQALTRIAEAIEAQTAAIERSTEAHLMLLDEIAGGEQGEDESQMDLAGRPIGH